MGWLWVDIWVGQGWLWDVGVSCIGIMYVYGYHVVIIYVYGYHVWVSCMYMSIWVSCMSMCIYNRVSCMGIMYGYHVWVCGYDYMGI